MKYSKDQLQEMAKPHFKALGLNKLFATTDGQFFVLSSRAQLHAGSTHTSYMLEDKTAIESSTAENPTGDVKPTISVKDLITQVETETDLTKLSDMLLEEVGGPNRKTAVSAIEKRIAFVTDPKTGE
jgi:hypothetical protein